MKQVASDLVSAHFSSQNPCEYQVVAQVHNNQKFHKADCSNIFLELLSNPHRMTHSIPDLHILAFISNQAAMFSVVSTYEKFHKFNIRSVCDFADL